MSFTKVRKTKIHLNAFFRQPVVSPYPTGIGLDFLGVTTKAHLPAQDVEIYSWMYQLRMQNVGCWRQAPMPYLVQPHRLWETHFVLGWGDSGDCAQVPNPVASAPIQWGLQGSPFCLHYVVWGFSGRASQLGRMGSLERKLFWKALLTLIFFVKINTFYRSIWTGKYHYLHSEINFTVVCINTYFIYMYLKS